LDEYISIDSYREKRQVSTHFIQPGETPSNEPPAARWARRLIISLTVFIWIIFAAIAFWLIGHIINTIILFAVGAILAVGVYPLVKIFERVMPRWLAILIVYIIILGTLGALLYWIITTAISQSSSFVDYIQSLLQPGNGQARPIIALLNKLGITTRQIQQAGQQLVAQLQGALSNITLLVSSVFSIIIDVLVVGVVSIYLLANGTRIAHWLRASPPRSIRGRVNLLLDILKRVIGGYIRGEILLALIIGFLVGVGMQLLGVPFSLLLGVLAFLFEFVPIFGVIITGFICVFLALISHGWLNAILVLLYFLGVHTLEGYVIGPRIIGRALRIHPLVSLFAVIAGEELYGILGIVFSAPIAGIIQAILVAVWTEWRAAHREQFAHQEEEAAQAAKEQDKEQSEQQRV
jgi:predicted PurR-regulated permease PerM